MTHGFSIGQRAKATAAGATFEGVIADLVDRPEVGGLTARLDMGPGPAIRVLVSSLVPA